jgi:hypothetical protein
MESPLLPLTNVISACALSLLVACSASGSGNDTVASDAGEDAHAIDDAARDSHAIFEVAPLDSTAPDADARVDAVSDAADAIVCSDANDVAKLPPGVSPPLIWFWRGISQENLTWYTDTATGRRCGYGDTTMWFRLPDDHCGGAPACDPDHFGTSTTPCAGTNCSWRNWDDPRGPELRVTANTGPVSVANYGAKLASGAAAGGYGFEVVVCAMPGTKAVIDTCPRCDVHSCVESNYPQFVDACDPVKLPIDTPGPGIPPSSAGCYSTIHDVSIVF